MTMEKPLSVHLMEKFSDDREQVSRYSAVAQLCPIPTFIVAHDGTTIVFVNKAYQKLVGMSLEELQNFGWVEAIHPDDRDRAQSEWHSLMDTDAPLVSHRRYISKDGTVNAAILTAQRVEDNGYVGFIVPDCFNKDLVSPAGLPPAT